MSKQEHLVVFHLHIVANSLLNSIFEKVGSCFQQWEKIELNQ